MDQQQLDRLKDAGIDVTEALARFMNKEALMMKFLLRFPQEASYRQLCEALEGGDVTAAFEAAHALKGVAGNLSLKRLYGVVSLAVEDLRAGDLAAAQARMAELSACYRETTQAIESLR